MHVTPRPDASVIIVSYNTRDRLRECLQSLFAAIGKRDIEVIVIDNASRDGSADMVGREFRPVRLVRSPSNLGFAAGNNFAFRLARGRYVLLLNPDALIDRRALHTAIDRMDALPQVGLAGGRLMDPLGHDQPSARRFPSLLDELIVISGLAARFPGSRFFGRFDRTWADRSQPAEVDWVPGAFAIIRRQALDAVGHFDERFFLYYEEVDLCRRLRAGGHQVWYWPDLVVHHIGGESSRTVDGEAISSSGAQLVLWRMRSALLYYRKHHGRRAAWALAQLESTWHRLRRFKATAGPAHPSGAAKAAESARLVELMRRAWQETHGGQISPPRPW